MAFSEEQKEEIVEQVRRKILPIQGSDLKARFLKLTDVSSTTIAQGDVFQGDSGGKINRLVAGTAGQALTTGGASADAAWAGMTTQGDVEYHNGTTRTRLGAGTSGQFLQTQGAGANPQWADSSGPGYVVSDVWTSTYGGGISRYGTGGSNSYWDINGIYSRMSSGLGKSTAMPCNVNPLAAYSEINIGFSFIMDTEPTFSSDGSSVFGLGMTNFGYGGAGAITDETIDHAAILYKYVRVSGVTTGSIYASVADGTTQNSEEIAAGLTKTSDIAWMIKLTSSEAKFYADGTLVKTLSSNLPNSTPTNWIQFGASTDGNVNNTSQHRSRYWSVQITP